MKGLITFLILIMLINHYSFSQMNNCSAHVDSISEKKIYTSVEKMPFYKTSIEETQDYINKNYQLPTDYNENVRLVASLIILKDGTIERVKLLKKSENKIVNRNFIILLESLKNWTPAYCMRRAWTIYFLNRYYETDRHRDFDDIMLKEGHITKDFNEKKIEFQGESPGGSVGKENGWFYDLCPEVHLFDSINSWSYFQGTACTKGTYDKELKVKANIQEEKHFSECAEFSHYLFNHQSFSFLAKTQQQKKTKPCYTYLMQDRKNGLYKIGISNSPKFREKTLHGQQPEIELLAIRKFANRLFAKYLETELHLEYKNNRTRGEWFDLDGLQVEEILRKLNEK